MKMLDEALIWLFVIPAKAGIHAFYFLDSGSRRLGRNDEQEKSRNL